MVHHPFVHEAKGVIYQGDLDLDEDGIPDIRVTGEAPPEPPEGGQTVRFRLGLHGRAGVQVLLGAGEGAVWEVVPGNLIGPDPATGCVWVQLPASGPVDGRVVASLDLANNWRGPLGNFNDRYVGLRLAVSGEWRYVWVRLWGAHGRAGIGEWGWESRGGQGVPAGATSSEVPNDHFENATLLAGNWCDVTANNTAATLDPGESLPLRDMSERTLWWRWVAPMDGFLRLTTRHAPVETCCTVYRGETLTNLVAVAGTHWTCDERPRGFGVCLTASSEDVVAVEQGGTYWIAGDTLRRWDWGDPAAPGQMRFQLSFASLQVMGVSPGQVFRAGHAPDVSVAGGPLDGDHAETGLTLDRRPGGPWNTSLQGLAQGEHVLQAWTRDSDGLERASLPIRFHVRPSNDRFEDAQRIEGGDVWLEGNNYWSVTDPGERRHPSGADGSTLWYQWRAPSDGLVRVSGPQGWERAITVWQGTTVSNLVLLEANQTDPQPVGWLDYWASYLFQTLHFSARQGENYWIQVDTRTHDFGFSPPTCGCDPYLRHWGPVRLRLQFNPGGHPLIDAVSRWESDPAWFTDYAWVWRVLFTTGEPGDYILESSTDLTTWKEHARGVTSGYTHSVPVFGIPSNSNAFFRVSLQPARLLLGNTRGGTRMD